MISWSYSRLSDFETCKYRFKLKYLDKLQETTAEAALRGTDIHGKLESYLRKETEEYPCEHFQGFMDIYREQYPNIEEQWGFNSNWEPCDWKEAWVRMIPDFYLGDGEKILIHDFKTGKKNNLKHTAQGQLYALGAYQLFTRPIEITFWYVDSGDRLQFAVKPQQIPMLQKTWTNRASLINHTQDWKPQPSKWGCKYCSVSEHCDFRYTE